MSKNSLKSPSSFKLINVNVSEKDASISYDTLYHIGKIRHNKYDNDVIVDSIKIMKIEYPKCLINDIEYDASNSYGAIIRETEQIYVITENEVYFPLEYFEEYKERKFFDHTENYHKSYSVWYNYLNEGDWVTLIDLGEYL